MGFRLALHERTDKVQNKPVDSQTTGGSTEHELTPVRSGCVCTCDDAEEQVGKKSNTQKKRLQSPKKAKKKREIQDTCLKLKMKKEKKNHTSPCPERKSTTMKEGVSKSV